MAGVNESDSPTFEPNLTKLSEILQNQTFSNMELDTVNYIILSTPKLEDAGRQNIKLKLSDNENNQIIKTFEVLVIETSPCETDTLITKEEINKKPEIKLKITTKEKLLPLGKISRMAARVKSVFFLLSILNVYSQLN